MLLLVINLSSLYHKIVGIGEPVALHVSLAVEYSFADVFLGNSTIIGGYSSFTAEIVYIICLVKISQTYLHYNLVQ